MAISNVYNPPIKQYSSKPVPQAYDASGAPVYANAGANLAPANALNAVKTQGFTAPQQTQYDKTLAMFKTPVKSVSTKPDGSTTITSHTPAEKTDPAKTTPPKTDTSGGAGTFTGATGGLMGYGTGQNNNPLVAGSAQTQSDIATGNNNPIKTAQTGLQNIATNGSQAVVDAQKALKDFQTQSAGLMASLQTNPNVAGDVASSRNNAVAQNLTAQGNALAKNLENALAQQTQQITAGTNAGQLAYGQQGQQITASENVGALGTSQQGQNIGALGTAGGLTQKSGTFPFVFDPSTGQYTNAGGGASSANGIQFTGNVNQDAQTAAQAVMSGKMTYQQAQQSMSYAGSTANNFLNSAILNAGGDVSALEAKGAAKQANISTSATASTNAANSAYASAISERGNADASYGALTGISNQVASTLANWKNTGAITDLNSAMNTVASHLSNPDYQAFITAMGNAQASYQAILGSSGVTPTKADQDALNALSPNSSATTIIAALNQLSKDAHALVVQPAHDKVAGYESSLGINQ